MRRLLAAILFALLSLPALAQDQAEEDQGFLTSFIEEQLSATAREVRIRGFAGALSSRATIDEITIADEEGVWLRAEDLALQWSRSALFRGRIAIDELTAGTVEVLRAPVPDPQAPTPEATPFSLPELPVSLEIGQLRADRVVLAEELLGEELVLTLRGAANLSGGEGTATLSAEILEGSEGSLRFSGGYSNATRILFVSLDLQEAEGGLAARALGIPGLPSVALRVEGTAPVDDYSATIALATDGEERIAGEFALKTTQEAAEGEVVARAFGLDVRGDVTPLLPPEAGRFFGEDVVLRTKGIRRADGSLVLTSLGIQGEAVELNGQAEITPEGWPARIAIEGEIGVEEGTPVPLPGVEGVTVRGVTLDVAYDRTESAAWTGTFAVDDLGAPGLTIRALTLDGGGTIEPATETEAGRFTADLGYAAQGLAFSDRGIGAALGADLSGTIDLVRSDDGGPLRIEELTLSGPGLQAQAEGTVSGAAEGFLTESSIQFEAQDLGRFAELTGLSLGGTADLTVVSAVRPLDGIFSLVLAGETEDLALGIAPLDPLLEGSGELRLSAERDEAGLRVETLSATTDAIAATGSADITSGASTAEFDLAVSDLGLAFPELSGPGTVRGTFERDATGAGTVDADVTLPGATLALDAELGPNVVAPDGDERLGPVAFTAEASVEELADFRTLLSTVAPGLTVTPAGAADLSVSGTADPGGEAFDVTVDAATRDLAIGQPAFDAAFAGEGRLSGRVIRTGPEAFRVENLSVDTPLLDGTLSGELAEDGGQVELDLRLADVEPVLGGLEGPGAIRGTASRAADGSTALDLDLTLPTGTAQVDGTLADAEAGHAFTGDVALDFADLAPLGPLLGRDLGGAVSGTASGTVRPDLSAFDLAFDLSTQDLRLGIPALDPLLAGPGTFAGTAARTEDGDLSLDIDAETPQLRGSADAVFADGTGEGRFDLALTDLGLIAPGLSGPATAAGTATQGADGRIALDAQATGPGLRAVVDATVAPPARGSEVAGTADLAFADLSLLSPFVGRPLSGAFDGTVSGTALPSLDAFDLAVQGTTGNVGLGIEPLDRLLAGTGTVAAEVAKSEGGPITVQSLAVDLPNLDATASGDTEAVTFDLTLADAALFAPAFPGEVTATGTARFAEAGPVLDAQVTGPGGLSTRVSGPVTDLRLVGTGDLAILNRILEPRRLEGPAAFDLRLAGPSLLALSGTVTTEGASLTDPALGEAVRDIRGSATLGNGTVTLDLTGAPALGGTLSVQGPIGIVDPFTADLAIQGTGLVIRDPGLYEATGNATIAITGPLAGGAAITGTVDIAKVEGRVPASGVGALGEVPSVFHIEPSVPVVETLRRAGLSPEGQEISPETGAERGGGTPYSLDLLLNAPARVFIRGRGLDAELGGTLRLTGTTTNVVPIGQFSLLRGRLDLLGQRFTLTEGAATLQGDFNPFIRVAAETQARTGTRVAVVVEGPLASPDVSFVSTPPLPEDEVLAQLLFGVEIARITPLQAVRLASAVATLAGEGTGVLDRLRGGFGLADFDVTTTETGGIGLRLGQYLTENVYTDVIVAAEETEATINLDLTPDLTVRAGVDTQGDTSLGIFFERDY